VSLCIEKLVDRTLYIPFHLANITSAIFSDFCQGGFDQGAERTIIQNNQNKLLKYTHPKSNVNTNIKKSEKKKNNLH
jgi:hypothetical protein